MIHEVHDLFLNALCGPLLPICRYLGVTGGMIERSCYSPHYVNTKGDYERDYQAALPQGRTAADGCKPRHGRDDRKRERSFSGLRKRDKMMVRIVGADHTDDASRG